MKKAAFVFLLFCLCSTVKAQTANDEKAIRYAILNYVESFYNADTTKV